MFTVELHHTRTGVKMGTEKSKEGNRRGVVSKLLDFPFPHLHQLSTRRESCSDWRGERKEIKIRAVKTDGM